MLVRAFSLSGMVSPFLQMAAGFVLHDLFLDCARSFPLIVPVLIVVQTEYQNTATTRMIRQPLICLFLRWRLASGAVWS